MQYVLELPSPSINFTTSEGAWGGGSCSRDNHKDWQSFSEILNQFWFVVRELDNYHAERKLETMLCKGLDRDNALWDVWFRARLTPPQVQATCLCALLRGCRQVRCRQIPSVPMALSPHVTWLLSPWVLFEYFCSRIGPVKFFSHSLIFLHQFRKKGKA